MILLSVSKKAFVHTLSKYPIERDVLTERARQRNNMFESYKRIVLIKFMKTVVKKPYLVRKKKRSSLVDEKDWNKLISLRFEIMSELINQYELNATKKNK